MSFLSKCIDTLCPPRCGVCGELNSDLCTECAPQFEDQLTAGDLPICSSCGEVLDEEDVAKCPNCVVHPLPYSRLRTIWRYTGRVESLIKAFKYGGQRCLAKPLAFALAEKQFEFIREHDLIASVPSGLTSLRNRGYSHLTLLCRELSRFVRRPYEPFLLLSVGDRVPQASLSPELRRENVCNAFQATKSISEKRVVLIDDMLTTGASLQAAADTLLKAGAAEVGCLTLARAEKFHQLRLRQKG